MSRVAAFLPNISCMCVRHVFSLLLCQPPGMLVMHAFCWSTVDSSIVLLEFSFGFR